MAGSFPMRLTGAATAVLLLVAACGSAGGGGGSGGGTTTSPGAATTTAGSATVTVTKTVTVAPTNRATPGPTSSGSSLPGKPTAGPPKGARVSVFAVPAPDTLRLRARPGMTEKVLLRMSPTRSGIVTTGSARIVNGALWWQLKVAGLTGWSAARFLGLPADTTDVTSEVVSESGGTTPTASTMLALGMAAARTRGSTEPASRYVVAVGPTRGDLGEVTIDVVGLGDDAIDGERLHVFGTPGATGFTLKSVEMTPMCSRGVSSGRCV